MSLPCLTPMSEIAGRLSVQEGAKYLEKAYGGRGILLGGVPGVQRGNVGILGGGIVGTNACKIAVGIGANVTVLDINARRLAYLDDIFGSSITTLYATESNIEQTLRTSDIVVGAVLVTGATGPAPHHAAAPLDHAEGRGHRGRGHRPGRLRGDLAADHARRPDLPRRRHRALLRGQHARRGGALFDHRPDERHAALRPADRLPGPESRARRRTSRCAGASTPSTGRACTPRWRRRSACRTRSTWRRERPAFAHE